MGFSMGEAIEGSGEHDLWFPLHDMSGKRGAMARVIGVERRVMTWQSARP